MWDIVFIVLCSALFVAVLVAHERRPAEPSTWECTHDAAKSTPEHPYFVCKENRAGRPPASSKENP